jgi:hypothetical protein
MGREYFLKRKPIFKAKRKHTIMKSTLLIAGVVANLENDFSKLENLVKDIKSHVSDQERRLRNNKNKYKRVLTSASIAAIKTAANQIAEENKTAESKAKLAETAKATAELHEQEANTKAAQAESEKEASNKKEAQAAAQRDAAKEEGTQAAAQRDAVKKEATQAAAERKNQMKTGMECHDGRADWDLGTSGGLEIEKGDEGKEAIATHYGTNEVGCRERILKYFPKATGYAFDKDRCQPIREVMGNFQYIAYNGGEKWKSTGQTCYFTPESDYSTRRRL